MENTKEKTFGERSINEIFREREDFLVVALTGRIGSGCTTASKILAKSESDLSLPCEAPEPGKKDRNFRNQQRQERIIENYARTHWKAFDVIKVRDIITSFILEDLQIFSEIIDGIAEKSTDIQGKIKADYVKWAEDEMEDEVKKCLGAHYSFVDILKLNEEIWKKMDDNHHILENDLISSKHFYVATKILPKISEIIRSNLFTEDSLLYTKVYQHIGNLIRTYGKLSIAKSPQNSDADSIFSIAKRINYVIKMYRKKEWFLQGEEKQKVNPIFSSPVRIVIDSIKNLFEGMYLRDRYSAFYLIAIAVNESKRQEYLKDKKYDYNKDRIQIIDLCEMPSVARKKYQLYLKKENYYSGEIEKFFEQIEKGEDAFVLWQKAYSEGTYTFNLQDVEACVQNADIFINNDRNSIELEKNLVRYICLMMHPGLVQPSQDERCMQIAQVAKLNSGCVSRQVGAVVCDKDYNIVSVGWNQPSAKPGCEIIHCGYRNFPDCYEQNDQMAYSKFERTNEEYRAYLNSMFGSEKEYREKMKENRRKLQGIPMVYCFKDLYCDYSGAKNQVHTRSQHAEEIALESTTKNFTIGGCLYTTSCSCELCAKKALHYGISRMVYIENYTGITDEHVLGFPDDKNPEEGQIKIELFTGACHRAYTQLYTPIFPLKDELKFRGVSFSKKNTENKGNSADNETNSAAVSTPPINGAV